MIHLQHLSQTHTIKWIIFKHIRTITHEWNTAKSLAQTRESNSNCPPLTIDQSSPSCTFQTHALTPPWLCWPLTWGEGACCLMVWIHSLCVKSFPASVTVRGKRGCVGWPQRGQCGGQNPKEQTQYCGRHTAFGLQIKYVNSSTMHMRLTKDCKGVRVCVSYDRLVTYRGGDSCFLRLGYLIGGKCSNRKWMDVKPYHIANIFYRWTTQIILKGQLWASKDGRYPAPFHEQPITCVVTAEQEKLYPRQ